MLQSLGIVPACAARHDQPRANSHPKKAFIEGLVAFMQLSAVNGLTSEVRGSRAIESGTPTPIQDGV